MNASSAPGEERRHEYRTLWNRKVAGFTLHTFSEDYRELHTEFLDYEGNTLHTFSVTKRKRRGEQANLVEPVD